MMLFTFARILFFFLNTQSVHTQYSFYRSELTFAFSALSIWVRTCVLS